MPGPRNLRSCSRTVRHSGSNLARPRSREDYKRREDLSPVLPLQEEKIRPNDAWQQLAKVQRRKTAQRQVRLLVSLGCAVANRLRDVESARATLGGPMVFP